MVMTMRISTSSASPCSAAAFRRGFLAALPFIASNGIAGVAMGVAYRGLGLGFTPAVLFSLVVYSATAQAVTLGLWASPPPIAAMAVACVATNARYLVMGAHLRQLFPDVPRRVMLPILFLLADASWFMTVAEAERGRRDAGYLLGSSLPMAIGWIGGTALGYALPMQPHGPLAVAAAFLPLAFVAALLPTQWRGWRSLLPWSVSAAIGLTVASTLGQSWAMLIGGGVGTLVSALGGDDA
jgi:predicted branched-subunit amino acid permease